MLRGFQNFLNKFWTVFSLAVAAGDTYQKRTHSPDFQRKLINFFLHGFAGHNNFILTLQIVVCQIFSSQPAFMTGWDEEILNPVCPTSGMRRIKSAGQGNPILGRITSFAPLGQGGGMEFFIYCLLTAAHLPSIPAAHMLGRERWGRGARGIATLLMWLCPAGAFVVAATTLPFETELGARLGLGLGPVSIIYWANWLGWAALSHRLARHYFVEKE